jgi:hypothetical protein
MTVEPELADLARRVVAACAVDADDCALLLEALGLAS